MRARRAAAWLLVRLAALLMIPVMVVLLLFIGAMALLTEWPLLATEVDWAACWRRGRRVAHVGWAGWDGPRHTGRYGFGGDGCRPDPMPSHYSDHPRAHFVMSPREWEQLLTITRRGIVSDSMFTAAVGHLGGGYGGADVFIDRCPWDCPAKGEAVMGGFVYREGVATGRRYADLRPDDDALAMRTAFRIKRPPRHLSFLDGAS